MMAVTKVQHAICCSFGRVSLHIDQPKLPLPGHARSHAKQTPHQPAENSPETRPPIKPRAPAGAPPRRPIRALVWVSVTSSLGASAFAPF
jgi:hypothetical protein